MRFQRSLGYSCLICLASCNAKKTAVLLEPKIAKTVPLLFNNAADSSFTKRQDTVFFNNQLYSGYRYELYPNHDTAALQSYFNGVEEGTQQKWYPGGQRNEIRFYINGKKEGTHEGRYPSGKKRFWFTAYDDKYSGSFYEWYPSGLLGKAFHYCDGQEEGSERLWWDNGTVRANYVIRNGKKYGLIGLKTCVNPYDSINKK